MEQLAEHGVSLPPNMQGLTDEQIEDLKLQDEWGEKCMPQGGAKFNKDTIGCRNGQGIEVCVCMSMFFQTNFFALMEMM